MASIATDLFQLTHLVLVSSADSKVPCRFNSSSKALLAWVSWGVGKTVETGGVRPQLRSLVIVEGRSWKEETVVDKDSAEGSR